MSEKSAIAGALTEFVDRKSKVVDSLVCTVDSYDAITRTCYCIPINDGYADIQQVKICPHDGATGTLFVPKEGSLVMVTFMSDKSAYISMFSQVDSIALGGVSYGGLVKVASLTTKLNNLENKVNALITAITAWVPASGDGGAALKVSLAAWLGTSLTPTIQANLESTMISHGDGTT